MTPLPADAPQPYRRSQLGPNALAYIRRMGWQDSRYVQRLEPAPSPTKDILA